MTDRRERAALGRIYECLNQMTGIQPSNPADIKAVSRNLRLSATVTRSLMYAVFGIQTGDLREAADYISDAEAAIAEWKARAS